MAKHDPRILLWDIEASHLAADYGRILCIGYKWLHEKKVHLIRIRDTAEFERDVTDDRGVLAAFIPVFEKADLHVTWFGEGFDLPFVQTRLMMSKMKPLASVPHVDGWRIARKRLKFRSNRLDGVSRAIPVPKEADRLIKTPITPEQWVRGQAGHSASLKYIEDHCKADVLVLEQVYLHLRPFGYSMPNLSKLRHPELEGCPSCGDKRLWSRGYRLTVRGKQRKMQCQGCGHWTSLPVKIKVLSDKP